MKSKELRSLGVPRGEPLELAIAATRGMAKSGQKKGAQRQSIKAIVAKPAAYFDDVRWGPLAKAIVAQEKAQKQFVPREIPAPYTQWGMDLELGAVTQMQNACSLPVSVAGALMPDAHLGYGLPIGGVLATHNSVIPYAVGMDIACRMSMTVLDWPVSTLQTKQKHLRAALEKETCFGVGATFPNRRSHSVMDEDWSFCSFVQRLKDKAWSQLGTSGSGNHFVEFGTLTLEEDELGLEKGIYLALLSHSGSRGSGAEIARHYSDLAMKKHSGLPKELMHLAWLDLSEDLGQEYWNAMTLMGQYAAANHELIHHHVLRTLGAVSIIKVENHHNFAWIESHYDQKVVVHRKGATPATVDTLGIIPGSMATPGYVVRGKGEPRSLNSASHGAGRRMSRKAAKSRYTNEDLKRVLKKQGVTLLSAGLDEVPMAYKDIDSVMAAQRDLVAPLAKFEPKLVKMAPAGERPED